MPITQTNNASEVRVRTNKEIGNDSNERNFNRKANHLTRSLNVSNSNYNNYIFDSHQSSNYVIDFV